MIATTSRWSDAIYTGYQPLARVWVEGAPGTLLEPLSGSVTLDLGAQVRGTCEMLFDGSYVPQEAGDPLSPFGNELRVSRGIRLPDGYEEVVSLGVFVIQDVRVEESAEGLSVSVTAEDRSALVAAAVFEEDYTVAGGSDYLDTIVSVADDCGISFEKDFIVKAKEDGSALLTPTLTASRGDDRWAFIRDMAAFIGCDLYFDNNGILVLREIPSGVTPQAYIVQGEDGAEVNPPNLLDLGYELTRRNAFNRWIVIADNADADGAPAVATATDDDEASPTFYGGPFGRKPEIFSSAFIEDVEQATDAAEGKKQKERGIAQTLNFGSLVNPALEPGDAVHVKRTRYVPALGETVVLADEVHIIDSLSIPLADGAMAAQTRVVRVESA